MTECLIEYRDPHFSEHLSPRTQGVQTGRSAAHG